MSLKASFEKPKNSMSEFLSSSQLDAVQKVKRNSFENLNKNKCNIGKSKNFKSRKEKKTNLKEKEFFFLPLHSCLHYFKGFFCFFFLFSISYDVLFFLLCQSDFPTCQNSDHFFCFGVFSTKTKKKVISDLTEVSLSFKYFTFVTLSP